MKINQTQLLAISLCTTLLAMAVVVLGAYVRLSDAGLGCPDWPGCYGFLGAPADEVQRQAAQQAFPGAQVHTGKAWKEMIHRYCAGTLGFLILALALVSLSKRQQAGQPVRLPLILLGLVIFQAALGMWTVTLKLKPVIVMAHLLGGFATLSLLVLLSLRLRQQLRPVTPVASKVNLKFWSWLGLTLLVCQIALGGWTSANYAALACPDFPTCQGQWWPTMDMREGFRLWRELGVNYEGGLLSNEAQMAVHFTHRLGALATFLVLMWVGHLAMLKTAAPVKQLGILVLALLAMQIALGISNVIFALPLLVAVAHNGIGACLLLSMVTLTYAAHVWVKSEQS